MVLGDVNAATNARPSCIPYAMFSNGSGAGRFAGGMRDWKNKR